MKKTISNVEGLIFIDAPGLGNEDKYFDTIINCFSKIGINFQRTLYISKKTSKQEIDDFNVINCIYFLMGGNPLAQFEIIIKNSMIESIRDYEGLVIGFCAGAINLSKYSFISTDADFSQYDYIGIGRIPFCIEPGYNKTENQDDLQKRNHEIAAFIEKYHTKIIALPDDSIIVLENDKVIELGLNYHFE